MAYFVDSHLTNMVLPPKSDKSTHYLEQDIESNEQGKVLLLK